MKEEKHLKSHYEQAVEAIKTAILESQYQDWITRYECNTKTQEEIFERLSFKKWEINERHKWARSTWREEDKNKESGIKILGSCQTKI